jgi:hypothetical protein
VLDIDHFDSSIRLELDSNLIKLLKPGTLIVWENLYASQKSGLSKDYLEQHPQLLKRYECKGKVYDFEMTWALFQIK